MVAESFMVALRFESSLTANIEYEKSVLVFLVDMELSRNGLDENQIILLKIMSKRYSADLSMSHLNLIGY